MNNFNGIPTGIAAAAYLMDVVIIGECDMGGVVCSYSNNNECGELIKTAIPCSSDLDSSEDRERFKNDVQIEHSFITDTSGFCSPLTKLKLDNPSLDFIDIYYSFPRRRRLIRISRKVFNSMEDPSLLLTLIPNDVGKVEAYQSDILV